jgi:8-oxo-dGTP diphosphatase
MKSGCGILLFNENHEVLICKRSEEDGFGKWCFVGGKVEDAESASNAIVREVKEEVDLNLLDFKLINIFCFEKSEEFLYISNDYSGNVKLQENEISEVKWVSLNKLGNYDLFEPSRISLEIFKLYGEANQ